LPTGQAGQWRDELAGGEVIEGAEAGGQLVKAQAAVAVERAYKLDGVALRLVGVAIQTARDEVAVGIAAEACLRDDVVEAPPAVGDPPRTIEAAAALAFVDGLAQDLLFQEIRLLDVDNDAGCRRCPMRPDFRGAYPLNL